MKRHISIHISISIIIHQLLPQHLSIWNLIRQCVIWASVVYTTTGKCQLQTTKSSSSIINKETYIDTQDRCKLLQPESQSGNVLVTHHFMVPFYLLWCWQCGKHKPLCTGNHVSITLTEGGCFTQINKMTSIFTYSILIAWCFKDLWYFNSKCFFNCSSESLIIG